MKKLFYAGFLALFFACSIPRNVERDINTIIKKAPSSFPPENRTELQGTYHRGLELYKATCTGKGCHGARNRGTDTIPHFNMMQLDNYEKSAKNHDPENHAVTAKLSPEQLSDILSFLFLRTLARQIENEQPNNK